MQHLGPVAQLVEHLTFNQVVTGSNPVGPTNKIKHLAHIVLGAFLFWVPIGRLVTPHWSIDSLALTGFSPKRIEP